MTLKHEFDGESCMEFVEQEASGVLRGDIFFSLKNS